MNILIVGVGGQGSLLASRIFAGVFSGMDVKVSEVHGMSQRGGSVVTTVRAGENIYSPLIPEGETDLLIALEFLEGLRWAHTLKPGGAAVVSTQEIMPMPVLTGAAKYPEQRLEGALLINAAELAAEAGNPKAANVVLLGAASTFLNYSESAWLDAIESNVKPRFLDVNKTAFMLGRRAAKQEVI